MTTVYAISILSFGFMALEGWTIWLLLSHIGRLEVMLKARDLAEVKSFDTKRPGDDAGIKVAEEVPSLMDIMEDKTPDQIRSMFTAKTAQPTDPGGEGTST